MKLQYFAVMLGLLVILVGCVQPEMPAPPGEKAPALPVETVSEEAGEEASAMEKGAPKVAPVATNKVKLVSEDGYVSLETKDITISTGSSVTFEYAGGERGKTVVVVTDADGKLLAGEAGKSWTSGYLTIDRTEWVTPVFAEPGVYKMKVTFGKADKGTITVK